MRIAIIGAGMAGCACGIRLREAGHAVQVFDKGRGPGGRMSTRRMDAGDSSVQFDHGAPWFDVRDARFVRQIASWQQQGLVERWPAAGQDAWVGSPAMNAPVRNMAALLGVHFNTRIECVARVSDAWFLHGAGVPTKGYDAVVIAVPAEQVAPLIAADAPQFAQAADSVVSEPCWTAMLAFESPLAFDPDTIGATGPVIDRAVRNTSKPDRGAPECWVVQASADWSRENLECDAHFVVQRLRDALVTAIGTELPAVLAGSAHRWRYARPASLGRQCEWDGTRRLGLCADWLTAPSVEGAWLSGTLLAQRMIAGQAA